MGSAKKWGIGLAILFLLLANSLAITKAPTAYRETRIQEVHAEESPEISLTLNRDEVIFLIEKVAKANHVPVQLAIDLIGFESGFDPLAKSKISSAKGLGQWIDSSWKTYCTGDVYNPHDSVSCTLEMIAKDKSNLIVHYAVDPNTRKFLYERGWIYCTSFESNKYCWVAF